jgi:hypothetical protein
MELVRRRTERWQRDMRHREREFVGQKAEMLLQTAFQVRPDSRT